LTRRQNDDLAPKLGKVAHACCTGYRKAPTFQGHERVPFRYERVYPLRGSYWLLSCSKREYRKRPLRIQQEISSCVSYHQLHLHYFPVVRVIEWYVEADIYRHLPRIAVFMILLHIALNFYVHRIIIRDKLNFGFLHPVTCVRSGDGGFKNPHHLIRDKLWTKSSFVTLKQWYVQFDRLCGLVVRVSGYRTRGPGSIPRATRYSDK
jgi:hypothetical protein